MTTVSLPDGTSLDVTIRGHGRVTVLLPVRPDPLEGPVADAMRQYGGDPALGQHLMDGLTDVARVVAFDYDGHRMAFPRPETFTAAAFIADILAVADAASVDHFV